MADGTRSKSTEAQIQELKQAVKQLKQAVEIHGGRSDSDQRFKTWEQTTMTTTSFQEESKIEITQRREHNFEVLTELLRDLARKETLSAATNLDKGVESGLETKNSLNRTPKSDFLTPDDKNQEEVQFHSEQPKPGEEFVKQATESPTSSLSCNLGDSRVMDQLKAIAQGRPTVYQETHATQNSTRDISFSFEIEGVGDPTIAWGISIDIPIAHQLFVELPVKETAVAIEGVDVSISSPTAKTVYKVFEKMPPRKKALRDSFEHNLVEYWLILIPFDRGRAFATHIDQESIELPYDRGKGSSVLVDLCIEGVVANSINRKIIISGVDASSVDTAAVSIHRVDGYKVFDPGGVLMYIK